MNIKQYIRDHKCQIPAGCSACRTCHPKLAEYCMFVSAGTPIAHRIKTAVEMKLIKPEDALDILL